MFQLNNYKKSIGKNGYTFIKEELGETHIKQLKKDLTVLPKVCQNYGAQGDQIEPILLYQENEDKIYIPRYFGINKYGTVDKFKIQKAKSANLNFNSELRSNQKHIVECYTKNIDSKIGGGGVICAGCGVGKTVISLFIASHLKVKTLVIVHKEFLMNQWIDRINQFLPGAKVGTIQGTKTDVIDKDIVIGMLQSVSMHKYENNIFDDFGLAIYDECHHLGARVFSKALRKTNFKYTLGLSATPTRKDGLTKVFLSYLGNIVYKQAKTEDSDIDVLIYHYNNSDYNYCKEELNFKKQIMNPKIINNIAKCKKRNDYIISLIPNLISQNRTILILTERIAQVDYIYDKVKELEMTTIGKYIGKLRQDVLDESLKCRIIIGTYNMIEEGFDCKTLDTLIMATPKVTIEQSVGRILRKQKEERTIKPLVIDIYDLFANNLNKGKKRLTFYKKQKYRIKTYNVNDDQIPTCIVEIKTDKTKSSKTNQKTTYQF